MGLRDIARKMLTQETIEPAELYEKVKRELPLNEGQADAGEFIENLWSNIEERARHNPKEFNIIRRLFGVRDGGTQDARLVNVLHSNPDSFFNLGNATNIMWQPAFLPTIFLAVIKEFNPSNGLE